ncbi:hypothetical protein AADZ91_03110 [Colwelliaceae bacterium 6441]
MIFSINTLQCSRFTLSALFIGLISVLLLLVSFSAMSKPKIKVIHGYTVDGFARVQIKNETSKQLACWVAIDGFKQKFRLPALSTSRWFTANDKRYNYTNFSTWCDNIDFYPQYLEYPRG